MRKVVIGVILFLFAGVVILLGVRNTRVPSSAHLGASVKHCTYTVGCSCPGFAPKTDGKEWEKAYCKRCGHHKRYHK